VSSSDDWLAAMNDLLIENFGGCTCCGRWPLVHAGIHTVDGLAIAISVCQRCHTQDPQQARLAALLMERYAPKPSSTDRKE
jgi:hypothetical protein